MTERTTPLERYARILEVLVSCPQGISLSQIAQSIGVQASSAHRLVNALSEIGFVDRLPDSKTYVLGARMQRLCTLSVTPTSVIALVEPELHQIVREFSETAYLTQFTGTTVESIATAVPDGGDMAYVQPGRAMPLHAAASAKAILAHQSPDLVRALLAGPLQSYTEKTKTDLQEIMKELQAVRTRGIAVCDNELDAGVLSYAVPVQGADGTVKYAIGISGFAQRMNAKPVAQIQASLIRASRILAAKIQQVPHFVL
ncbi:IclR family transcriptional regulator [Albidovulum sp.]|jgi:DNA-binding IclR family transcriptional regulator|uniref:IclR family transcriptional regulator n=1 Tax=Albidovulum sp. TaxID=1872424 RepID=UPI0039B8A521